MLKVSGKRGALAIADEGRPVTTLREMQFSLTIGEQTYKITRRGLFSPTYELRRESDLVVSAQQAPFVNRFAVKYGDKVWTLKAVGLTAKKFALLHGESQVGAISPTSYNPYRETIVDLPSEMPIEAQVFLIWIVARRWGSD
jgi:hypothetical protein